MKLSEVVAKWIHHNVKVVKAWKESTRQKYEGDIEAFVFLLEDPYIEDITRKLISDKYASRLGLMPKSIKSAKKYRVNGGLNQPLLPADEIIRLNEEAGGSVISDASVGQKVTNTMSFLNVSAEKGWLLEDYSTVLTDIKRVAKNAETISVLPFASDDLKKLFISEGFKKIWNRKTFIERKYLPLIALFTGARLGEIGQLRIGDIKQEGNIWFFDITTDEYDDFEEGIVVAKSLKTKSSKRKVPIHKTLIDLGLMDYYNEMKRNSQNSLLFPSCKKTPSGAYGRNYSRWFNGEGQNKGYMVDCGVIKKPAKLEKKVFHSLRHTFINQFKQQELGREMGRDLTGHAFELTKDIHKEYESEYSVDKKKHVIDKIDYALDFDCLMPTL